MDAAAGHIELAIAFDRNYLLPFYALMASIVDHHPKGCIRIHSIATGVEPEELRKIEQYVEQYGHSIRFYEIDQSLVSSFTLNQNWTHAVYYRLLFPFLVPSELERLLYIDTDTLVVGDLRELFDHPLTGFPVGAVYDNYVRKNPDIGIDTEGNYFNSGMLLIDLPEWKRQKVSERAFDYLEKYPERISFVDQDALNAVLVDNWYKLDFRFNTLYSYIPTETSRAGLDQFLQDKLLLHFTLQRPWERQCKNRFRHLYFHYLRQAGFTDRRPSTKLSKANLIPVLKRNAVEFYWDNPLVRQVWKTVKQVAGSKQNTTG